jgi:D-sedoheptulose 7-phosphate isomerase
MKLPALSRQVSAHQDAVEGFFRAHEKDLINLTEKISGCLMAGGKLLFCGNGGSACDAMHIAGEFVGRFIKDRKALAALALSNDPGILTAVGNDYGYEYVFARQVEAHGRKGDILIGLSTSGTSPNVLAALKAAKKQGLYTVLLTGKRGTASKDKAHLVLVVPAEETARVQEVHMLALHILTGLVEQEMGLV